MGTCQLTRTREQNRSPSKRWCLPGAKTSAARVLDARLTRRGPSALSGGAAVMQTTARKRRGRCETRATRAAGSSGAVGEGVSHTPSGGSAAAERRRIIRRVRKSICTALISCCALIPCCALIAFGSHLWCGCSASSIPVGRPQASLSRFRQWAKQDRKLSELAWTGKKVWNGRKKYGKKERARKTHGKTHGKGHGKGHGKRRRFGGRETFPSSGTGTTPSAWNSVDAQNQPNKRVLRQKRARNAARKEQKCGQKLLSDFRFYVRLLSTEKFSWQVRQI